jgi:hypothetical protein
MKRQYGVFHGLLLSLFSPAYYRDVARHWGGIGFVYLLLLLFVTWVPILIHWQTSLNRKIQNDFPEAFKDFPKITIQNGKVSSPVEQPLIIKDPNNGQVLFVLDTTGQIDNLDKTPAPFLLTETQLHLRDQNNPNNRQVLNVIDILPDAEISKEVLQEWLASIANWFAVALFPFAMVGSLIRALIVMLLAGVGGLIFRPIVNPDISYGSLLRLAAMGLTLPTYIDTGMELSDRDIPFPFWFFITVALTSLYVIFGARAGAPSLPAAFDDDFAEPPRSRGDEPRGNAPSDAYRA